MSVLRHPEVCVVCSGKLSGAAEISLERVNDKYFINVSQTAPLDWGICPQCGKVVCHARCWDQGTGQCKTCASFNKGSGNCPGCRRVLTGAVEIIETETFGIPTILLEETPDRNWIQCDACSQIVCKLCCLNPKSGFCNQCLALQSESEAKFRCPVVVAIGGANFISSHLSQTTKTKIQTNQEDK